MLKPLEQFICDTCGQVIETVKDGYLEWEHSSRIRKNFRIIHATWVSPLGQPKGCFELDAGTKGWGHATAALEDFLTDKGLGRLLEWLDPGPYLQPDYDGSTLESLREYAEFFKRLRLPYYEEARHHFAQAVSDGVIDDSGNPAVYSNPNYLKAVAEQYSEH